MESWCFDSLEKSYVSNQTVLPKNVIIECDFKTSYSDFPHEGIAEILAKKYEPKNVEYNDVAIDEISCLKHGESSLVDCSSRDSSLIDLKLGGVSDHNLSYNLTEVAESTITAVAKRARGVGMSSQSVYCQVYGCSKDLSSAKDYHKRHKVCDVHSKTARVVVNGIEQRFCQQCSRFHLLAEFDDGKRSCRKRLAGHNERRRKPHVGFGRNRSGRSLHSYTGSISSKFQGTTLAATSFICQDILGPTHSEKHPSNCWSQGIKLENEASAYGHLDQKTMLPHYLFQKQYTSGIDNRVYTDNINHYSCDQTNGVGSEDLTLYDTVSTIHGIPGMSESGCALSLLSSQSHNSHSSSTSIVQTSCLQFGTTELYGDVDVHGLSCGDGTTIDLLRLSSQLQRVENQRQSGTVKQDSGRFLLFE